MTNTTKQQEMSVKNSLITSSPPLELVSDRNEKCVTTRGTENAGVESFGTFRLDRRISPSSFDRNRCGLYKLPTGDDRPCRADDLGLTTTEIQMVSSSEIVNV